MTHINLHYNSIIRNHSNTYDNTEQNKNQQAWTKLYVGYDKGHAICKK